MTLRSHTHGQPIHSRHRGGAVVIVALACLLIVTAIVSNMLTSAVRARQQLHAERDRRQAELLLDAGADRVVERLTADPDYRGDTWELLPEEIVGHGAGRVTTQLSQTGASGGWQAHVVAEYPLGRDFPVQRSRTFLISPLTAQSQE